MPKLGLIPKVDGKEPDTYIPTPKTEYLDWPVLTSDDVFDVMSIAQPVKLVSKSIKKDM